MQKKVLQLTAEEVAIINLLRSSPFQDLTVKVANNKLVHVERVEKRRVPIELAFQLSKNKKPNQVIEIEILDAKIAQIQIKEKLL